MHWNRRDEEEDYREEEVEEVEEETSEEEEEAESDNDVEESVGGDGQVVVQEVESEEVGSGSGGGVGGGGGSLVDILVDFGAVDLVEELRKRDLVKVAEDYFRLICDCGTAFAVQEPGRGKSFIALAIALAHIAKFGSKIVYIIAPTKNIQELYLKLAEKYVPHDKVGVVAIFGKEGSNIFRYECRICPGKSVADSSVPCERVRRLRRYGKHVSELVLEDGRVVRIEPPFSCPEKLDLVPIPSGGSIDSKYRTVRVVSFVGEYHYLTSIDLSDITAIENLCPYYRQFALLYYYLYVEKKPVIVIINLRAFEHNKFRLPAVKRNDLVIWDEADKLMLVVESIKIDREFMETLLQELDKLCSHEDPVIRVNATSIYDALHKLYQMVFVRENEYTDGQLYRATSRVANDLLKGIVLACTEGEFSRYYPEDCKKAITLISPPRNKVTIRSILRRDYSAVVGVTIGKNFIVLYREINEPINNIPLCNMLCMTATPPTESEIQVFMRRLFRTGNKRFAIAKLMGRAVLHVTGIELDITRNFFDVIDKVLKTNPDQAYHVLSEIVIRLKKLIDRAMSHGPVYIPVHHVDPYLETILRVAKYGEHWAKQILDESLREKMLEATRIAKWLVKHVETSRMNRGLYTKFEGYVDARGNDTIRLLISTCVDRGTSLEKTGAIIFLKKPLPNFDLPEIRVKADRTGRLPATVAEEECLRITLQWLGRVLRKPNKEVHIYTLDKRMLAFLRDVVSMYVNMDVVYEPETGYVEIVKEPQGVSDYGSLG